MVKSMLTNVYIGDIVRACNRDTKFIRRYYIVFQMQL